MAKNIIKIFFIVVLFLLIHNCCTNNSGLNLGNHLQLWGDNEKYYKIVFCDKIDIFGNSKRCSYIIPTNEPKDDLSEYVDSYVKNNQWIIVKTNYIKYGKQNYEINLPIDTTYKRYWIIDKSFNSRSTTPKMIINSYLIGPMDSITFHKKLKEKKIDLRLE